MHRLGILIVEDEASVARFVESNLRVVGYEVLVARTGEQALQLAEEAHVDLVILDLMLPGIDGLEVCRRLRSFSDVPVVVLSARGELSDKVDALSQGADDYLTKPFGVEELLARVQAVLRRTRREGLDTGARALVRGGFELDPGKREVTACGRKAKLTPTEFDLLHYLMRHAGEAVPHNLLLEKVWGPEYRNQTEYLRVYIGRLRRKIEPDPDNPQHLLTEYAYGYLFRSDAASA